MQVVRLLGLPFSLLYSSVLFMRNRLYDWRILKSNRSPIRSIVVGNLNLGGTGKSPMVEYLIRHFSPTEEIAVISRGFGRKTSGLVVATSKSTASEIGDEPVQILRKFPEIQLFVDTNRNNAMAHASEANCTLALLDDAFQHRAVTADVNILLTRFDRPWFDDWVIPSGTLRDHPGERKRADLVVVTNSPVTLTEKEKREFRQKLRVVTPVFFASTSYLPLYEMFEEVEYQWPKTVVALTGIANPTAFINKVENKSTLLNHLKFPDHHAYSVGDIQKLHDIIGIFADSNATVVTTEKDACRLREFKNELNGITLLVLPIQIKIDDENFQKYIDQRL